MIDYLTPPLLDQHRSIMEKLLVLWHDRNFIRSPGKFDLVTRKAQNILAFTYRWVPPRHLRI